MQRISNKEIKVMKTIDFIIVVIYYMGIVYSENKTHFFQNAVLKNINESNRSLRLFFVKKHKASSILINFPRLFICVN